MGWICRMDAEWMQDGCRTDVLHVLDAVWMPYGWIYSMLGGDAVPEREFTASSPNWLLQTPSPPFIY